MKKSIILLVLLTGLISLAQTKSITVKWSGSKELQTENFRVDIPYFSNDNAYNFDLDQGLLFMSEWESNSFVNPNSVVITNVEYALVSETELRDLKKFNIPNEPNVILRNAIDRDKVSNLLYFSPIIKEGSVYKKVISISVSYSGGVSNSARSFLNQSVSNSVLSTGSWYKFAVDKSGVHIIDKAFLNQLGINTIGLNPRNIKIYGNGGHMMPYLNSDSEPLDPTENAIKVIGEEDGVFNDTDFILFYAEGPTGYDTVSNTFLNIYNSETYYYINVGPGNGKRIQPFIQTTQSSQESIDNFKSTQYHELDEINLAFVGRRWFGDKFDVENVKDFSFTFPNLDTTLPVNVKVIGASASGSASNMVVKVNGIQQAVLNFPGTAGANAPLVDEAVYDAALNVSSPIVQVNLEHDKLGNPSSEAYLDYISVEGTRALTFNGQQFQFSPNPVNNSTNVATLNLNNALAVQEVWEVSDIYNVKAISNPNLNTMAFKGVVSANHNFNVVTNLDYYRPKLTASPFVFNQNLKGTIFNDANGNFKDIDYLLLTPSSHLAQANRLAQINRNNNGLNVKVVTLEAIYNEFNTGNPDISAIRNFIKICVS